MKVLYMKINIEGIEKEITVIKKKRKTISIKITNEGEVIVSTPLYVSNEKIKQIIENKKNWIASKLKLVKSEEETINENKDCISFLGIECKINIYEGCNASTRLMFENNEFHIYVSERLKDNKNESINEILKKWYRLQARNILEKRTTIYAEKLKVYPNKIFIKDQKTRWGSCSSKGNINYNYRIIMTPLEVIDYLVVHELCHMVHLNHSKEFWNLVGSIIPNYKDIAAWLKANGHKLRI
jgi:predicted metal-dependent hydrolase